MCNAQVARIEAEGESHPSGSAFTTTPVPTSLDAVRRRMASPSGALATAAANAGVANDPIPACWIGTAQPTSRVNLVLSMVYLLHAVATSRRMLDS